MSSNFHNLLKVCKLRVSSSSALHSNVYTSEIKFCIRSVPLSRGGRHFHSSSYGSTDGSIWLKHNPRGCNSSISKNKIPCVPPQSLSRHALPSFPVLAHLFVEGLRPVAGRFLQASKQATPPCSDAPHSPLENLSWCQLLKVISNLPAKVHTCRL